ncbi:AAA family ATPase [Klosneuvirus KNV1]|mgnify:CR=1 FL=1|uniref:AAA family ATPase n=1 Tax=Klosneuvirus KNV1 TaxID=1977640 RepID=A0A1V0SKH4_9VIRU|nr:AAA family ATPase [Klosneuvirus KNV1]
MDGIKSYLVTVLYAIIYDFQLFHPVVNVTFSMALANIIVLVVEWMYGSFKNMSILKYFIHMPKYYIIKSSNTYYNTIIEYLYKKYINQIHGGSLIVENGNHRNMIEELSTQSLDDTFTFENKDYKIIINLKNAQKDEKPDKNKETNDNSTKSTQGKDIIITGKCPINILEAYTQDLIIKCQNKDDVDSDGSDMIRKLLIYRPVINDGKNRFIFWNDYHHKTNKTIKNTIVSDDVNKMLYQDIKTFIDGETFYAKKGIPYKRGYILHGEAGCGKTSVIKAIAGEYKLPMFIVDLSVFRNNNELTKIISEINGYVMNKQKYMLIFEDIDRSQVFDRRFYDKRITEDCLLNIFDGLDETYGRITILTTNDVKILKAMPSLTRPGRMDVVIKLSYCTINQVVEIMKLYCEEDFDIGNFDKNIVITPAKLIQLLTIIKDSSVVINVLNKYKDFTDLDIEDYINDHKEIVVNKHKNDNDDENIDKIVPKYSWEKMMDKKTSNLEKMKKQLAIMEKNHDAENEKQKLLLEKKKIEYRIHELELEAYIVECQDKKKASTDEVKQNVGKFFKLIKDS